jgi:rhodanese-related sulfurtransferase
MKNMHRWIWAVGLLFAFAGSLEGGNKEIAVKIEKDTSYYYINQSGQKIKVGRVQDVANRLTDDFTKTSRTCPPYCIQPISVAEGVETIGELELIEAVKSPTTLLVDARPRAWFVLESLPGAVNIPEKITRTTKAKKKLFKLLAGKHLIVYGNGSWSPEASTFITNMIHLGYPADKLRFYRDGLQGWKLLGLTTVIHQKHQVQ